MFATISIRTKISAVVAILLLVMSCMGALAIKQMYGINAATVDIASNWLPSIRTLSELRSATIAYRGVIRSHLLADDDAGRKVQDASIARYTDQIANARKEYEPLITSPEEQALYDEFAKYWSAYVAELVPVLEGSRKGADKAIRDLNLKATKTGMLASAALEKDVELNNRGALLASDRATQDFSLAIKLLIGSVVFAIIVGIVAAIMLVRDVSRGINSIIVPMQALGNGDLAATVPHQGEATEIGKMADTLQVFKLALIDKKAADEAASTDAEVKIERGRRVDGITRAFEAMIGDIVETVSSASNQLEASAGTLTSTAERSQELATAVAAASEEASTNVQSVASATEEMASSVNEISRQVQESATIASQAVEQARKTNDRVSELAKAASRIGDVVELINTIAGQTNLLALNATIEAARAGEAGRGFAVVASEVKALAEQTAKATGEISMQISGIQAATQDSVNAIKEIGDTIGRMSEISSTIASAVEEQGAATQEISRNVQQAAQGTMEVSSNITDVQRGASETGSASSEVLSAAQSLSGESSRLKLDVGKFLSAVRAA
ncbi:HAMP domain-containing protein [Tardiphaga sp. vice352]|uniref:methyl-accepting chemotaxis protein n=1 Tax=unclassified Tardiphaga TaxID=2631404 RepID=UPI00116413B1|nr:MULTISPECIES: methyl-accepting chemotaxis protein [unclassified Tardiphaga]QDM18669.1 HAMP domain-containing protein [Tardiphaga sp. vice278]QDM28889.1 HAMP domain-containing protein [Tardiphaga sp. vice304]QDM33989.1 HAMP domain-containing protein [Tardiphaga sp. vice352]